MVIIHPWGGRGSPGGLVLPPDQGDPVFTQPDFPYGPTPPGPGAMTEADGGILRSFGLSDSVISDVAQITAYFNYINRVADGLGIDPEDFMLAARAQWDEQGALSDR